MDCTDFKQGDMVVCVGGNGFSLHKIFGIDKVYVVQKDNGKIPEGNLLVKPLIGDRWPTGNHVRLGNYIPAKYVKKL